MIGLCKNEVVKVWLADEGMRCVSVCMCAVITVGVGHVLLSVKRPDPRYQPSHSHIGTFRREREREAYH